MAHMRILTIVMAAVMLLTSLMVPVSAADDNKHTAVFGTKSLPLAQYDPGKGTSAFTKNGKLCAKVHDSGESSDNCYDFTYQYTKNGKRYTGTASQCLGFAFYVQQELFGFFYQNSQKLHADKFDVIRDFDTGKKGSARAAYAKEYFSSILLGAHIRTRSGHSLIFMDANDTHVWTYEANVDHRCQVTIRKRTWTEMYDYLKKRDVNYIASPKRIYLCAHDAYDAYGRCAACGTEFALLETVMSSAYYRTTKADVPLRMRPYAPEPSVKTLKKGAFVTVVAQAVNVHGNKWLKTSDGMWIYSGNVKKFTCVHTAKASNYSESGICRLCKKEYGLTISYPLKIKTLNVCMRAAKDNVPVRDQPYAPCKTVYSVNKNDILNIVGSAKNAKGNTWYLLDDGRWIYSGNVARP